MYTLNYTMESDYKFRYVNDYITNLLDGNITLQYEDTDLKSVKKPIEYLDKIEKWLEFRNRVRDEDPDEFAKITGELFTHLLAIRLGGVIVDHTCEYCDMAGNEEISDPEPLSPSTSIQESNKDEF
ncbi:hypothetical protein NMY3_01826 [Candidatus Nitrosocosmicus oleophilus]|jgi:hypothetical protein|uniref:Uncharacterized protein n=1 Tax=Candidatus Nitrosocosmicus oleophilus TaxID=1353260 RepID=A0A654M0K3_9ARCH|nr:hypothetical protein NMY3_01826 [Candidatus Nitrosocosmicus oleophilus]